MEKVLLFTAVLIIILGMTGGTAKIMFFLTIIALLGTIMSGFMLTRFLAKALKESIRSKEATNKWLIAQKRLSDFLERFPYIDHPEAQVLLEDEIMAYKEWLKIHPGAKEDTGYLNMLLSMRKRKTLRAI